jgi:hypothetical protein
MTLATRLKRLEQSIQRAAGDECGLGPKTEEEWLAAFEEAGRRGWFDAEPDFPKALQFYRQALQTARSQANPTWDPPEDFLPRTPEDRRRFEWHRAWFAAVSEGLNWLQAMAWRRARHTPPVGEAEYYQLAAWLRANRWRLEARSADHLCLVDLGWGRTSAFNLELLMESGPRQTDAGVLAEAVRQLQRKFETRR